MKGLLEELPTPSHDFLKAPEMDDDLKAYFAGKKDKVVTARDANWQHVESKLKRTMGPLGRLWEAADQARKGHLTSVKAEELLRLVEKTAVGQAAQSVTYYRRTEVLFPVLKEKDEVKKALRNHADKLPTSGKLFGKDFQAAVFKDKTEISDLVALARREEERRKRQQQKQNQQRAPNRSQQGDRSQQQRSSQQSGSWSNNSRGGNYNQPFPAAQSYKGTARRGHGQGPSNRGTGSGSTKKQGQPKQHSGYVLFISSSQSARSEVPPPLIPPKKSQPKSTVAGNQLLLVGRGAVAAQDVQPPSTQSNFPERVSGRAHKMGVAQLATADLRHRSSNHSVRVRDTIDRHATSQYRLQPEVLESGNRGGFTGRSRNGVQRSSREGDGSSEPTRSTHFPTSQEGRVIPTSVQSEEVEHERGILALQNGRDAVSAQPASERRLAAENRLEGRIFLHPNSPQTPEAPQVLLGRGALSVHLPPLRPGISATGIHKGLETSSQLPAMHRDQDSDIPGRYATDESGPQQACSGRKDDLPPPGSPRFHCEQKEIRLDSHTGDNRHLI